MRASRTRCSCLLAGIAAAALACAPSAETDADGGLDPGRALYDRHGCALCHGPEGRGDGPIAATLEPPPRDLGDPSAYRVGSSQAEIASTIEQGILVFGGSGMAPYAHIPETERQEIARFIVSMQP